MRDDELMLGGLKLGVKVGGVDGRQDLSLVDAVADIDEPLVDVSVDAGIDGAFVPAARFAGVSDGFAVGGVIDADDVHGRGLALLRDSLRIEGGRRFGPVALNDEESDRQCKRQQDGGDGQLRAIFGAMEGHGPWEPERYLPPVDYPATRLASWEI